MEHYDFAVFTIAHIAIRARLASHPETRPAYRSEETIREVVAAARMILDAQIVRTELMTPSGPTAR